MTSGSSAGPAFSRNVVPAGNDAGRELLDNLEVSGDPQMTPQDVERMKQLLQAKFVDESLIFALHRFMRIQGSEIQQRPTLQQYSHFIHHYEADITSENINLRIGKENDKRCVNAFLKELQNRSAENNEVRERLVNEKEQLVMQNEQLSTEKEELATQNEQLTSEKEDLATRSELLATQNELLATKQEQMASEIRKLKAENAKKDMLIGKMKTEKVYKRNRCTKGHVQDFLLVYQEFLCK
ncbi:unnamed protein product [Mytilus coruscus]|uniref:Uncharacterized protein n=1 Tax=Mytilus coruscus TaxID=42192 RepID=A0A6J8B845_MYTCO|nr:unnamed protein product [Mytilus coruscus]